MYRTLWHITNSTKSKIMPKPYKTGDIKLTQHFLSLERGEDELLLVNTSIVSPLYISRGRGYIKDFLKKIEAKRARNILKEQTDDQQLLEMLSAHKIVVPADISEEDAYIQKPAERQPTDKKEGMSLYLLVSQACNMFCIYCLAGKKGYRNREMMSEKVAFH